MAGGPLPPMGLVTLGIDEAETLNDCIGATQNHEAGETFPFLAVALGSVPDTYSGWLFGNGAIAYLRNQIPGPGGPT